MRSIGVVVLIGAALLVLLQPKFVANLDQKTYDVLTSRVARHRPSGRVVIVHIDEDSLTQYGRWPWPRDLLGVLIRRILADGADTVALDMMFPEPDLREISLSPSLQAAVAAANSGAIPTHQPRTADDFLAESLRGGRVIVGYEMEFNTQPSSPSSCFLRPLSLAMVETEPERDPPFFRASKVVCDVEEIARAAANTGYLNAATDTDGIFRRIPLLIAYGENVYPNLSLAAFMAYKRNPTVQLTTSARGAVALRLNDEAVPLDSRSHMLLRFRGAGGTFPRFSAADVLTGRVSAGDLRGKIVVVGLSAVGLQDVVPTSSDSLFPGFEVHATAIDNLLQNDSFRRPTGVLAWELSLMLVVGLASGVLFAKVSPVWIAPIAVSLIVADWSVSVELVSRLGIYLSPLPVTAVLGGNLACLTLWRVSTEKRRAEQQLEATRRYVLSALTAMTSIHDVETGAHIMRVQRYTELLSKAVARKPRFHRYLTAKTIALIAELAPIHDIGKVGIPDRVLRKPGRLTPEELEIMKSHTVLGLKVIQSANFQSQIQDAAAMKLAADIVYTHHEHWDGTGYPQRLRGDNIPIAGRLLAVADVYDALVSKRPYKPGMTHEEVVQIITEGCGSHFDPDCVDAFLAIHESMRRIKEQYSDENELPPAPSTDGPPTQET
jgi:CHASE2 domain-containing sensor protein